MSTADKIVEPRLSPNAFDKRNRWRNLRAFLAVSWKTNLAGAMEFRMSFLMTAGMMFINNLVWIFFWGIYFDRFQLVNGWAFGDVLMLWAVSAGGYGLMAVFCGNAPRIAYMVAAGQLDAYLVQPKPVLLHVVVSRMSVMAMGDILFGLLMYLFFGDLSLTGLFKFTLGLIITALIFLAGAVLINSLAFFVGNSEGVSSQLFNALIAFTTYPADIFKGLGKVMLFTVVPAGFISYLPIKLMREIDWPFLIGALAFSVGLTALAAAVFSFGLRRYTSGNRMGVRS